VDELKSEAKALLKSDPEYEKLMKDLGAKN
jgi:hypothetical protein